MTSAELAELIERHFGNGSAFTADDFLARTGRALGTGETQPATITLLSSQVLAHYPPAGRRRGRAVTLRGYYVLRGG